MVDLTTPCARQNMQRLIDLAIAHGSLTVPLTCTALRRARMTAYAYLIYMTKAGMLVHDEQRHCWHNALLAPDEWCDPLPHTMEPELATTKRRGKPHRTHEERLLPVRIFSLAHYPDRTRPPARRDPMVAALFGAAPGESAA